MINNTLQNEIKNMEEELLALKSVQGLISDVDCYTYTHPNPSQKLLITYEDTGNKPVTSTFIIGGYIFSPLAYLYRYNATNHTQKAKINYWYSGVYSSIIIVSTSPIVSVTNL